MAGTQGAHNSGEIIIWVGNNYCPKADIFGRQSLATTALVVQSFDSAITQIKIYSVDNAIGFPNIYALDLVIYPADSAIQCLNNWTQPFNLQQQQDQSFSRVLTGPDTGLRNWTHLDPVHNWAVPWLHTYASAILSFKMPEHACKKPLPTKNPGVEQPFLFGDTQANTDNPWLGPLWEIEGLFFI